MNVFAGHSDAVVACVFTSDGSKVVTSSADMTIRVWDPKTAQVGTTFTLNIQLLGSSHDQRRRCSSIPRGADYSYEDSPR